MLPCIYFFSVSFNKCILSTCCVLDIVLDVRIREGDRQTPSLPVEFS